MAGTGHQGRRHLAGLTLVATAGLALGACGGGGTSGGSGSSSSSSSATPSSATGTSSSSTTSSSSSSATSSGSAGSSSGTATTAAARCTAVTTRTRAVTEPGGGAAGSYGVELVTTNTGRTPCTLKGFPGVSLTAPGTGAQLGAAADREPGQTTPLVRLAPGASATALARVTQAGNYGSRCQLAKASGFRVYLPGEKAAQYAPYPAQACSNSDIHLLTVRPFHT
ncbi:DUF4232 domain-containing protein [Phycicoccus sp. M110.8]|uniref:DUF4232 domain-containing protein n=1 Tax=Phycicoccus sp. M110.8 TaxID=3075433 RepID=UPI0028FD41A1|nr:DUF4232 domain-containing protein [Phycicoccus sp. M110.8]MDU0313216.1 DUF4232 domain-containing protein [Phycicoccus sp. M110.8]